MRWGLMRNSSKESLADHAAEVAVVSHALALIGNRKFGKSYDTEKVALIALFHDATEVYTGDMPTPAKYFSPEMREEYARLEKDAAKTLLSKLPEEFREDYSELLLPDLSSDSAKECHRLVKAADKLCAHIKCITEEQSGNREFASALTSTKKALEGLDCPELDYFIENYLDSFRMTLDELQSF